MNIHLQLFEYLVYRQTDKVKALKTPPISFPCTISNIICSLMTLSLTVYTVYCIKPTVCIVFIFIDNNCSVG